jgi:S1/P1 Nuclease
MTYPSNGIAVLLGFLCTLILCCITPRAYSWGDEGHEIIGLIADHYLEPAVRSKVIAILAGDATHLTATTQIDSEATWADKYRDSDRNTTKVHYKQTHNWHFVDLELQGPDLKSACFGQPPLPKKTVASLGAADDCVVDKINEFAAELQAPTTTKKERRFALQFILHFVGDVHQPLHASDDHDQGGNLKTVTAPGIASNNLHHDWDTEFVARLGPNETAIAQQLIANITDAQRAQWASGTPADWAAESFGVAKDHSYGLLPAPDKPNHYQLTAAYVTDASAVTQEQLSKAGVRLASVLNQALR